MVAVVALEVEPEATDWVSDMVKPAVRLVMAWRASLVTEPSPSRPRASRPEMGALNTSVGVLQ